MVCVTAETSNVLFIIIFHLQSDWSDRVSHDTRGNIAEPVASKLMHIYSYLDLLSS